MNDGFFLSDSLSFPPPHLAGKDGILAVGGDLSVERLLLAYQKGIFPWFSNDDPIIWWSPDPRMVLYPEELKVARSLRKTIRKNIFHVTLDTAFKEVVTACAEIREQSNEGTWIVDDMIAAYTRLYASGFAHSVEVWHKGSLAGGLYGVSLGRCFFGESMFTVVSDASKVALVYLVDLLKSLNFKMIDCQVTTGHLKRLGAREISRSRFLRELKQSMAEPTIKGRWTAMATDGLTMTNLTNKNKQAEN
jgi:leucyl/phenylalanyl-tRNA--protein transferase